MLVGVSYYRFPCMKAFLFPYFISLFSYPLAKVILDQGTSWEYIMRLPLRMAVRWFRYPDIGTFFRFRFATPEREEGFLLYNCLDLDILSHYLCITCVAFMPISV